MLSAAQRRLLPSRIASSLKKINPSLSICSTSTSSSDSRILTPSSMTKRKYNFASSGYASCFGHVGVPDTKELRQSAVKYLESELDPQSWYDDPVVTLLKGQRLTSGTPSPTVDAFGRTNGTILHASPTEVTQLLDHVKSYTSPYKDLREPIRRIESKLLKDYAGFLIGNQAVDFGKQDGVTEIEESVMANDVERRLNDLLLADESDDIESAIDIPRNMAFVACVSNFSNFLDLFRKTIRNLEVGVPCVVLSRSNATQHTFRWTKLLGDLLEEEGLDGGMLTFASCHLKDIQTILAATPNSPLYVTCSRALARTLTAQHPLNTITSTGGPNTLFSTHMTPQIQSAIQCSASIENSGQCTALRHVVLPQDQIQAKDQVMEEVFDGIKSVESPLEALKNEAFDGVFTLPQNEDGVPLEEYTKHGTKQAFYRIRPDFPGEEESSSSSSASVEEYWRRVVVDITTPVQPTSPTELKNLSKWLIHHQPISLAMNVPQDQQDIAKRLFEQTSMVVYTVGSPFDSPALTCQARPQEAEIFGEFPPRRDLGLYTKFPVVVPSSTPACQAMYKEKYLERLDLQDEGLKEALLAEGGYVAKLLQAVSSKAVRGYGIELVKYLVDATSENPKRGVKGGARTALWGLQRPPMFQDDDVTGTTLIEVDGGSGDQQQTTLDDIVPYLLPFFISNARGQVVVSISEENAALKKELEGLVEGRVKVFLASEMEAAGGEEYYNVIHVKPMNNFPMVGQFVSLFLPMGHIKSTKQNDEAFLESFAASEKWLRVLTE